MKFRKPVRVMSNRVCRALCACWLLGVALLVAAPACAEETPALELQVKAAFLVKFGMFVEWPAATSDVNAGAPFLIGVLGKDPFGAFFDDALKTEFIRERPMQLRRGDDVTTMEACQIVFIAAAGPSQQAEHLAHFSGKPVLTVGDSPDFARRGGMIGFIKEDGKVRFEINTGAAERAGLKISSKLLKVGRIVTSEPTPSPQ